MQSDGNRRTIPGPDASSESRLRNNFRPALAALGRSKRNQKKSLWLKTKRKNRASRYAAVDKAAHDYVIARDKRMVCTEKEVEMKAVLIDAMQKAKLDIYRFDDDGTLREVTFEKKEKVKVKTVDEED